MPVVKIVVAVAVALLIYRFGVTFLRGFAGAPPSEGEPTATRAVYERFRCTVCGTEVTMTAAPAGRPAPPPRHCMEEMAPLGGASPN